MALITKLLTAIKLLITIWTLQSNLSQYNKSLHIKGPFSGSFECPLYKGLTV
jgi:hypothetical protein